MGLHLILFVRKAEFQAAEDIPMGAKLESGSEFVFLCRGE